MIHFGTNTPPLDLIEMVNELVAYEAARKHSECQRHMELEDRLVERQHMYAWG